MTNQKEAFTDTIDWDKYWQKWEDEGDEENGTSVSGGHFELVERFIERVGIPTDAAFVGCGPGILAAKVATAYPEMQVVGYDAAESIIKYNREEYQDVANLSFDKEILPEFTIDQHFDLVFTYGTLHYVQKSEWAIKKLYEHVRIGGHLICHYPNHKCHESRQSDEGWNRERFQLVIDGENILSQDRIAEFLDAEVRDFWDFVDAEGPFVRPSNACVVVDK